MTSCRFMAAGLNNCRFFKVVLILFFYVASATAFKLVDCKQDKAQEGSGYCKDAFTHTYSENKLKFATSPVKSGCCLTLSLRSCVEHAFTKARCDPKDQKVALLMRDQIHEAESHLKHAVDKFTSFVCGDYKRESCDERFLIHFNDAVHKINVLNGSPALRASLLATSIATVIGSLYALQWN